ncbi:WD domain, G-beta repeat-containing protein,protein kinase family protein [Cylindrospermum stagnale PCC 7417]|uniref:WD domain, G-beta repeat-containing protein,protein kinase family protein n=1 Tax=Cylindrospermum stagnale PCC 7417 TaxID=56107 RepID=K9WSY4_9NOST|nr:serine/threonine-protein kinase [Cylindrospermum stagnale]AFZ23328.1 WD domain, G-beta repeat-containing protein,protein kinase family protein [Cylindrospermum stagnale PCC 7417]
MSYCFNPNCQQPQNEPEILVCLNCGSPLLLSHANTSVYRGLKLIGQGGFGRTFLAVDESQPLKPRCAVKQFFALNSNFVTPEIKAKLINSEVEQLQRLDTHPGIPKFLGYLEQDGNHYLIQEFIDGVNLAQELAEIGNLDEAKIRQVLQSILSVLDFIHSQQVIHRDIKPENIIRRRTDDQLILVDFGAAKFVTGANLAQTGTVIGSPKYAAPEQVFGKASFSSDIYGLGVTCIFLLTGVDPFELYAFAEDRWVWQDYLPSPVSSSLSRILDKMISRAINQRYQLAAAVIADLKPGLISVANNENTLLATVANQPSNVILSISKTGLQLQPDKWNCILDLETNIFSPGYTTIDLSADGKILAIAGRDCVEVWRLDTQTLVSSFEVRNAKISMSSDGQILVSNNIVLQETDGPGTKVWHIPSKNLIRGLETNLLVSQSMSLSPDCRTLAFGGVGGRIHIWDLSTGKRLHKISGHSGWFKFYPAVTSLIYLPKSVRIPELTALLEINKNTIQPSSSSQLLASASFDKTIKIWDVDTGKLLKTFSHPSTTIAVTPDGKMLVSGSSDKTIKFWDLSSGELVRNFSVSGRVSKIVISPDGQSLVAGGGDNKEGAMLVILDMVTGNILANLEGHQTRVCGLKMSSDGKVLVSQGGKVEVNSNSQLKIWQLY